MSLFEVGCKDVLSCGCGCVCEVICVLLVVQKDGVFLCSLCGWLIVQRVERVFWVLSFMKKLCCM